LDRINFSINFLRHYFQAGTPHAVHSPFIFELYNSLLSHKQYYDFEPFELLRSALLTVNDRISVTDFGAGSKAIKSRERKISDIVKYSEKPKEQVQALFELAVALNPKVIVELGTSLGLTTAYLASVDSRSKVHSFEGCPNTLSLAKSNIDRLEIKNVVFHEGNFDDTLPAFLQQQSQVDFVFFDGNHRYEPTVCYFEWFLPKVTNQTVFIFDDIHWSKEMEKAWEEIKSHPQVIVSIDFFHFGVIFFKKELSRQHFRLKL
jgi:predicted O-methyltransferase YrrM